MKVDWWVIHIIDHICLPLNKLSDLSPTDVMLLGLVSRHHHMTCDMMDANVKSLWADVNDSYSF